MSSIHYVYFMSSYELILIYLIHKLSHPIDRYNFIYKIKMNTINEQYNKKV